MTKLPPPAECDALRAETANLIERAGLEPYVAAPLVEPTDRWFPDPWHATEESVGQLARRVMDYAGLDHTVSAEIVDDGDDERGIAWRIDDQTLELSVERRQLQDVLGLTAQLVRVTSSVYRAVHHLTDDDPAHERRCVDLTSVFLGFGIISTNAAYRYRASGEVRGNSAYTEWSHTRIGELSPQAMAYLLALQLSVRDASSSEVRAVIRQLERNQASYFEAAYAELSASVADELGLPDRATWPARRALPPEAPGLLHELRSAFVPAAGPTIPKAIVRTAPGTMNAGRPVFRSVSSQMAKGGFFGMVLATVPAVLLLGHQEDLLAGALMIGLPIVGGVLGRRSKRSFCSDPHCERRIPADATRCPGCGGDVVGTLLRGENRLEAEERLKLDSGYGIDEAEVDAAR